MGPGDDCVDCSCCTGSKIRRYLRSKFPFVSWARKYDLKCLHGDLIAGLTVGMMVIPQGLAYAHLAELPPNYGLYASFIGVLVYIFTGTAKDITIGPTAIMSQIVGEVARGNTKLALCCSLFAGCFQLVMGSFFLGFLVWVISTPILCGFTTAAALTIACGQLSKLLGIKSVRRQFLYNLYDTFSKIKTTRWQDAAMGCACLICLLALRLLQKWAEDKRNRLVPPSTSLPLQLTWFVGVSRNILVVLSATVAAYFVSQHSASPPFTMVGNITGGLPTPRVDQFSRMFDSSDAACNVFIEDSYKWSCLAVSHHQNETKEEELCVDKGCCWDGGSNGTKCFSKGFAVSEVLSGSILIASIGYLEHIAIGQSFAVKGGYQIDNSQELIALGLGNVVGSFFMSYPVTGSFSRTALNYMSGVKTPLVGLFTSGVVMLGLSCLSAYFEYVPDACLAAVIMVAVYPMIDFAKPLYLWKVSRKEFLIWVICFTVILCVSIEVGILVAVAVEIALVLGRNMWPSTQVTYLEDGTYDYKIDGNIWYLGAWTIKNQLSDLICGDYIKDNTQLHTHRVENIVIDFTRVSNADSTALDKIKEAVVLATKRDIGVVGYGMRDVVLSRAAKQGLLLFMRIEKTQDEAALCVRHVIEESAQPAYVRYDDSRITPRLIVQTSNELEGVPAPGEYNPLENDHSDA